MNPLLTEIVFILDRSGSMSSMLESAISGFNQLVREQQQVPGQARFSLVLFDDRYEVPVRSIPIAEVVELDVTSFIPRGSTALLDAVGRTIDELGANLSALPEAQRPGQVIVAILTDGEENASQHFTWPDVAARIRHQTENYQWQFLFLGANQDAIATAGRMNIASANTANFVMERKSYQSSKAALSRKMSAIRRSSSGDADEQTLRDAAAPLDEMRQEEEDRGSL